MAEDAARSARMFAVETGGSASMTMSTIMNLLVGVSGCSELVDSVLLSMRLSKQDTAEEVASVQ